LTRLGGPNFAQIPINRPIAAVNHHQQDGFHQHAIPVGQANYHPNSLGGGCPVVPGASAGAFTHVPERVDGIAGRRRSETFADHYSQATLFWNSMSSWEKEHIIAAYRFELGKVTRPHIRELMVEHLNRIDHTLALAVAAGIGVAAPAEKHPNHGRLSPALSQASLPGEPSLAGRKVAVLAANGVVAESLEAVRTALAAEGVAVEVLAPVAGDLVTADGGTLPADRAMNTTASVLYDAVVVADGADAVDTLTADGYAVHFLAEAYKHAKPLGLLGAGALLADAGQLPFDELGDRPSTPPSKPIAHAADGVVWLPEKAASAQEFIQDFMAAMLAHRHFDRPVDGIPA
jgi:catalase